MIYLITDEPTVASTPTAGKFPLGRIVATDGAIAAIPNEELLNAISRHHHADWGDLEEDDWYGNDRSLCNGSRLFSQYESKVGIKFWIITEHDRSVTTVLLPSEY